MSIYRIGLTRIRQVYCINLTEFDGFLKAEILWTVELMSWMKFGSSFIQKAHKLALGEGYSFVDQLRDLNLSKGEFDVSQTRPERSTLGMDRT